MFDAVFISEAIEFIHTPARDPQANGIAEGLVRSVRGECPDHLLIINQAHLTQALQEDAHYYNSARSHPSLDQRTPILIQRTQTGYEMGKAVCLRETQKPASRLVKEIMVMWTRQESE